MIISNRAKGPSFSTDPVAAAVRASQAPATIRRREPDAAPAGPAALDIDRLYPSLAATTSPPRSFARRAPATQ